MGAVDTQEVLIANSQFGGGATTWAPANNTTNWPAATTSSGVTSKANGTVIQFTNPTGTWGLVTYYGLFTASSGGTPAYFNPLDASISPKSGNSPVQFDVGALVLFFE
jgi:hypothetical protein